MKNDINFFLKSLTLLLLLLFSCTKKHDDNLLLSSSFPNKISIDLDDVTDVDFETYFSKIELIPLETSDSSFIKACTKLYLDEKNKTYYVFDREQNKVFGFNSNGHCILNSGNKFGEGPEEYAVARDFFLNNQNQTLDFLDPRGYIVVFDLKMNFLKKIKIKNKNDELIVCHCFMPLTKDIYITHNVFDDEISKFFFYSIDKESIIKEITIPPSSSIISCHSEPFKINANKLLYTGLGEEFVYQINPKKMELEPYLELDYGEKHYKNMDPKIRKSLEELNDIGLNQDYAFPGVIAENDNFTFIHSLCKGKPYFSFYNKTSKNIETGCGHFSNNLYISQPDLVTDEAFYCIKTPNGVKKCIPENVLNEENRKRMNALKEDDNPVIVKCYFKK